MSKCLAIATAAICISTLMIADAAAVSDFSNVKLPVPPAVETLTLPDGSIASIGPDGLVAISGKDRNGRPQVTYRMIPIPRKNSEVSINGDLPDKARLAAELSKEPPTQAYAPGRIIVVLRDGVSATTDSLTVPAATLRSMRHATAANIAGISPRYTNDVTTNATLATLGVDQSQRLFKQAVGTTLSRFAASPSRAPLNLGNAYLLHVSGSSVTKATLALRKLRSVAYASPDWHVSTMNTPAVPLPNRFIDTSRTTGVRQLASNGRMSASTMSTLPQNYVLASSGQSLLNAPSTNAVVAFDEIQHAFHQLPGQGEIITNVSLGDVAYNATQGPCAGDTTMHLIGGQMYLDWPSMPLIPAYTADANGNLSGTTEECREDSSLGEVGLDFSMMAPLPHDLQRAGETGSGLGDLLGIAPGANYRLVVPQVGNLSGILAAFLGAAQQQPRPNIITASLGFGTDAFGFPGRYLEDDPLTSALISSIVNNYGIVVCIASNDGLRKATTAAVNPSGGATPTELAPMGASPTNVSDLFFSTQPSRDFDSNAIDVGGTTLDDIFAAPPQNPQFAGLSSQHAFAETRWTGEEDFASGFGSRVNVSAPSDNLLTLFHNNSPYDAVGVGLSGGTSGSAPEAAAAAAVVMQVARLSGHPFNNPREVRDYLVATGSDVPRVSQSDVNNHIGPQINVGNAVETLLHKGGHGISPGVSRVAIEQRRDAGNLDALFLSDTDPANIDLVGPASSVDGSNTDRNQKAWITIAPDWEGLPPNAQFRLTAVGHPGSTMSATRWARLLPAQILAAAGLPLVASSSRTVNLRYQAHRGAHVFAEASFAVTFGPANPTTHAVLAPIVPSVVTGTTIPVSYDFDNLRDYTGTPKLLVSEPGRDDPWTLVTFHPAYSVSLTGKHGTAHVPVSALQGGGVYGMLIYFGTVPGSFCRRYSVGPDRLCPKFSDIAFTRVASTSSARPSAPLLSANGSVPGHFLDIAYGQNFQFSWDVTNVPSANGALLEVSAGGPTAWNILNPFNNPNGSIRDRNSKDSGSVFTMPLNGSSGSVTLSGVSSQLFPTFNHVIRVIPTNGGAVVGEASEVSTITMDGVMPADGGNIINGTGVNAGGTDGFITSEVFDSFFNPIGSSIQTFDQTSNRITMTDLSETRGVFFTDGGGVYPNDLALYGSLDRTVYPWVRTYGTLTPVATGTQGASWAPPAGHRIIQAAANNDTSNPAFFSVSFNPFALNIFTSAIPQNTFGPIYDVTAQGAISDFARAFGEDTSTKTAVLAVGNGNAAVPSPPTVVTVDLTTGKIDSTVIGAPPSDPFAFHDPVGLAIDTTTHKVGIPNLSGFLVYDLVTKATVGSDPPGSTLEDPAADSKNHLFLVAQVTAPDVLTDNNSLSSVIVIDEQGRELTRIKRFNIYNTNLAEQFGTDMHLNPNTRTGYYVGNQKFSLVPFRY